MSVGIAGDDFEYGTTDVAAAMPMFTVCSNSSTWFRFERL